MVHEELDRAMGEWWDEHVVIELFQRLEDRFPRHHKMLVRIKVWADDNSIERSDIVSHDGGNEDTYSRVWDKVMRAIDRLPW